MSSLRLIPGTTFAGDFEIVGPLAEGGMGAVYVARQRSTGKERALKIMQPGLAADVRTRERFTREARAGSQVDSEHVVEVVAAGFDAESGVPWLAMELLRGEDLASFAERVGPLPPTQTLEIFRQLCHGLSAAHATGLVHRDLKPENVFLATARRVGVPFTVKILDFGIAKVVQETKHEVTDAVGTPVWMSPEQTEAGRAITPASDVWALGLIAFRLLTGLIYWKSANAGEVSAMAILREVVFEPLEPASVRARSLGSAVTLSKDFDGWFARCVVRSPEKRLPHAGAALAALEAVLTGSGMDLAVAPTVPPTPPPTVRGEPFQATPKGPPKVSPAAETMRDGLPATRVGPFTGPAGGPHTHGQSSRAPTEDVDTYEKRLSGGKWWVWTVLTVVVAGGGYAAYRVRAESALPPPFTGVEREPNNRAPEANTLPFGEKMRGQIGQRLDGSRSDRDFFRTRLPAGTNLVRLKYRALPNIPPCLFVYRLGRDEPLFRFCVGQPGRDLTVPQLRLEPAEYLLAVMQDQEQYTEQPPPPVLENISDAYELELEPADAASDLEVEPNDRRESATLVQPGSVTRGKLAWMRDVDVVCTPGHDSPVQFTVEDTAVRPRGAVLEVTPLGGPNDGIPVRIHHPAADGTPTERDVRSPWRGPPVAEASSGACVSLALTRDVWSAPPFPRVAPAGEQEYVVRVDEP